ncbi:MAG: hypothetical protein WA624_10650 [Methylocella sp.]
MSDNGYLLWFRRVMWLGIVSNVIVAVVSITQTPMVLEFLKLPPAEPLVWPRFASFLLILLSGFYVPAALDPSRNIFAAIFAVVCRFGGVTFFSIIGGRYIAFGLFDFIFGLPEAILLGLAFASSHKSRK